MDAWENQLERSILARGLMRRGDSLLVAVSGGLDSMVLLHLLASFARRQDWSLTVAHFNHQLRGRSSDADERLVRKTAATLGLPIAVDAAAVKDFARRNKISIEMAARESRHEFLAHTARSRKIRRIALAHHADDQVELFFLRLFRGAGTEGLGGMKDTSPSPVDRRLQLIRPLLRETKGQLENFARANKIRFREDASNLSPDFPRNRIRHELLPFLEKYQPGLASAIQRSMELVGMESDFVGQAAARFLDRERGSFEQLHPAVQRRVLLQRLRQLGFSGEFGLVEKLRLHPEEAVVPRPGTQLVRDKSGRIHARALETPAAHLEEVVVDVSQPGRAAFGGLCLEWKLEKRRGLTLGRERNCEYFDAEKVGPKAVLRTWRPGDRFQPIGMPSPIKLQDLFTNAKVPAGERRRRVLALDQRGVVFWVQGLRISETFKLDSHTRHRLKWCWKPI